MVGRDFFSFSTSLQPVELRALGKLSQVRHLAAGDTIYSPGDAGDAICIINRGVVEITYDATKPDTTKAYFSRGDIFGDLEVLTGMPWKHLVRAHEPVSLQSFSREDFPELVARVPSFFRYVAEHLAHRMSQARDLALAQNDVLELSGTLANFDLVTIYQTIVNSSQTGELSILNEEEDLISVFFFQAGKPRCGQFRHLTGEEAFWQLFLTEDLGGTFSFASGQRPISDWIQSGRIARQPQDMLITALQSRDEFQSLRELMPNPAAILVRKKLNFDWPEKAPASLRPIGEQIWQIAYSTPSTLNDLYLQCAVCELKVYRVVDELIQSGHFDLSGEENAQKIA